MKRPQVVMCETANLFNVSYNPRSGMALRQSVCHITFEILGLESSFMASFVYQIRQG